MKWAGHVAYMKVKYTQNFGRKSRKKLTSWETYMYVAW